MPTVIPDTPIATSDEDELGRTPFAGSIADLILGAPAGASLRIGVYGGWGEGKTSVLKLIEGKLRSEGHHAVWLMLWATSTRQELLDQLLFKLAQELHLDVGALRKARRQAEVTRDLRDTTKGDFKLRIAESLLGPSLEGYFDRAVESATEALFGDVRARLKGKKLVVFVDDVDRIPPDHVPQLLLTLREVLDRPDFFYVLALAPDIVEKGLAQVHKAWGSRKHFLEKIIELPLNLPLPSNEQWSAFIDRQVRKFPPSPLWKADLADYLPRNPRKAKLFFRFAGSLERLLIRFLDEEMDWRGLALCLMLILEFPEETRSLATDKKAIDDLRYGGFTDLGDKAKEKTPRLFEQYAPNEDRARFTALCNALRDREVFRRGAHDLQEMLSLHEAPPILTWREFDALLSRTREKDFSQIIDWVERDAATREQRARAFFAIVLRWRNNVLDAAAESELEDELRGHLTDAAEALNLLRRVMEARLPLAAADWRAFYGQAAHWTHFSRPAYYAETRAHEREVLVQSLDWIPAAVQIGILALGRLVYDHPTGKPSKEFEDLTTQLQARLEHTAVDSAIGTFEEPDGVEGYWGTRGDSPEKLALFDPESPFHTSADAQAALSTLSQRAVDGDMTLQANFRTYFRMLTYAAFEGGGSFPRQASQRILQDADFVTMLWRAAVARPLNPRKMGSLRVDRANVIAAGVPESALPLPAWWTALEEELREGDVEAQPANRDTDELGEEGDNA